MSPKKPEKSEKIEIKDKHDRAVLVAALHTAIESYETNEKTFRQAVEDMKNGRDVPMFMRGDAGVRAATNLADNAYMQADKARKVLDKLTDEDETSEAEAS